MDTQVPLHIAFRSSEPSTQSTSPSQKVLPDTHCNPSLHFLYGAGHSKSTN